MSVSSVTVAPRLDRVPRSSPRLASPGVFLKFVPNSKLSSRTFFNRHRLQSHSLTTIRVMPWSLERHQQTGDLHFITFSCLRRKQLLTPVARTLFERALERP